MTSPVPSPTVTARGAVASDRPAELVTANAAPWFAVADGIGGDPDGTDAASVAAAVVGSAGRPRTIDDVVGTFQRANRAVRDRARSRADAGMGAALVAAAVVGDRVVVAHVGHGRCYRLAAGELRLVTQDHTFARELADLGDADGDGGAGHALRHRLHDAPHHPLHHPLRHPLHHPVRHPLHRAVTRALGLDPTVSPDVTTLPPSPGRLLLCTGDVGVVLGPTTIGRVLSGVADPTAAARRLVGLAAGRGTDGTVLVVDTGAAGP